MADLKSLAEIKLEVDLIMVDIEVLSESDKSEAIKYLETSLEELKLVSNWEIQSAIDNYRSENAKEVKAEAVEELEHEYMDAKRLKLEIPKADDEALKMDGPKPELEEEENIEKDLDYPDGSVEEPGHYEDLSASQEQELGDKNSDAEKSAEFGTEPEDFIKEEKIPEYVESVKNRGWECFDGSKEYTGHLDNSETFYPPYSQQDSYFYQNGPDHGQNERLLEESAPDENFEEAVSSFDSFSNAYPTNVASVPQFHKSSGTALMTNLDNDEPFVAPPEHSSRPVSSHVLYNGKIPTCTECNLTFPSLGVLDTHLKNGHRPSSHIAKRPSSPAAGSIEYVQSELPEIYPNDDGTFQCPFCSHSSKYKYNLKLHVNKHTGKYRCDDCGVNLYNRHTLDNHNRTPDHLKKVNQQDMMAPPTLPPVSINSQTAGLDSCYQASAVPDRDDVAEQLYGENVSVDGRNFSMDHLLDSSPHQMEEFAQNYSLDPEPTPVSQSSLNDYMNRQIYNQELMNEKPFSNLQKTYSCEECGNSYTKSVSFRRHLISHSDRFRCQTCGNGFTEQGRLNAHLRSKENCKKLLQKRGLPNDSDASKESNWPPSKWGGNNFEIEGNKPDFPPGLIVARKSQPPVQNSYSNSLRQHSSLAEKFFSNPNLSVQMKSDLNL